MGKAANSGVVAGFENKLGQLVYAAATAGRRQELGSHQAVSEENLMRRLKVISVVGAAMVMMVGLAGPAGAGGKAGIDPGRGNSTAGLANVDLQNNLNQRARQQITENIVASQNPDQPGVTPGGGVVEP